MSGLAKKDSNPFALSREIRRVKSSSNSASNWNSTAATWSFEILAAAAFSMSKNVERLANQGELFGRRGAENRGVDCNFCQLNHESPHSLE
jgi:hypothetical protein